MPEMAGRTAVVLVSGGLDSAVVLAWMQREGFECIALTIDYGQRHHVELECARRLAAHASVREHLVQQIDLRAVGGSALTGSDPVPKDGASPGIPITYVPARNTLFLSLALGLAEAREARDIALGINAVDYSGYPDCRPAFLESFSATANLATRAGVEAAQQGHLAFHFHAPLLNLSKPQIIRLGDELGVDFARTSSCYDPLHDGSPCGQCDSCRIRAAGFASADLVDPRMR